MIWLLIASWALLALFIVLFILMDHKIEQKDSTIIALQSQVEHKDQLIECLMGDSKRLLEQCMEDVDQVDLSEILSRMPVRSH